ncbi:MAG: tyrosine-type recombinase/integrase [Bacilli bacterium]
MCCSTYGKSRSRGFHQSYYNELMKQLNLPDIDFHDLRHTFTTLIVKSNFNAKAISQLLGHVSEIITIDVYTDNR